MRENRNGDKPRKLLAAKREKDIKWGGRWILCPPQSHSGQGVAFYLKKQGGIRYNIHKGQKRSKRREVGEYSKIY
ncbi:hypothetical protein [Saccharococcus thermophilus]|uniref:hypothetical protein n=1 Tax=Saccharococcus thermophilus TaxID=29396 RepID=UPI0036D2AA16